MFLNVKDFLFEARGDAETVLNSMQSICDEYGSVSMADFAELAGMPSCSSDRNYCWYEKDFEDATILRTTNTNLEESAYYIDIRQPTKRHESQNIFYADITNNYKEDKNMAIRYNGDPSKNCDIPRVSSLEFEDPIEVEFEKKKNDLVNEAEKKILDIRQELAAALDKLQSEQRDRRMEEKERSQAKMWKRKYDALIEAGFSEDQAWQMTMESFKID